MLMRICCFLAPPELGELGKPGSLARRLALGRPLALLCGLVRGIIRLIIVNYIRVAVPMTGGGGGVGGRRIQGGISKSASESLQNSFRKSGHVIRAT